MANMLDFSEFQNEKKVVDNQNNESKKNLRKSRKKKLHLKLNQFIKQNQEVNNITSSKDVGGSNYYDRFR